MGDNPLAEIIFPYRRTKHAITYAPTPLLNARADIFSGVKTLFVWPDLLLHPYFVFASCEGSCGSANVFVQFELNLPYSTMR